jgi:hypothetical protein
MAKIAAVPGREMDERLPVVHSEASSEEIIDGR